MAGFLSCGLRAVSGRGPAQVHLVSRIARAPFIAAGWHLAGRAGSGPLGVAHGEGSFHHGWLASGGKGRLRSTWCRAWRNSLSLRLVNAGGWGREGGEAGPAVIG